MLGCPAAPIEPGGGFFEFPEIEGAPFMAFDGCCVVSIEPGGELFKPPAIEVLTSLLLLEVSFED